MVKGHKLMKADVVPKIAIVEDSEQDLNLLIKAFNKIDFECEAISYADGEEAYFELKIDDRKVEHNEIDMFILDIGTPRVSGLELLKILKNDKRYKHKPVIMLSGSDCELNVMKSYENHANAYLVKPDSFEDLTELAKAIKDFWFNQSLKFASDAG